MSEMKWKCFNG